MADLAALAPSFWLPVKYLFILCRPNVCRSNAFRRKDLAPFINHISLINGFPVSKKEIKNLIFKIGFFSLKLWMGKLFLKREDISMKSQRNLTLVRQTLGSLDLTHNYQLSLSPPLFVYVCLCMYACMYVCVRVCVSKSHVLFVLLFLSCSFSI